MNGYSFVEFGFSFADNEYPFIEFRFLLARNRMLRSTLGVEAQLYKQIAPLQAEMNQLNHQFWVTRERLLKLEQVMAVKVRELEKLLE